MAFFCFHPKEPFFSLFFYEINSWNWRYPVFLFLCRVKVLILHQHFNTPESGGPLRSYYIAKALISHGIWPVIITTHADSKYKVEISEGMEVHYLPITYKNSFGFYRRSWSFLRYAFAAVALAKKFKDSKVCYAMSVPLTVALAAIAIKKLYGMPYIFEVGDLWPEAPIKLGILKNKPLQRTLYYLEKTAYRNALLIVALSEPISNSIKNRNPSVTVPVVPNMADTAFYQPGKNEQVIAEQGLTGKFVVSYIGAIGFANGLDHILDCARAAMRANIPLHFIICGKGAMLESLKKSTLVMGLTNVSFLPFQDRNGVKRIMEVSDAVFISYRPVQILETGSPNKYFDGLAAGKLIIINFGGWIRTEVEDEQCGVFIDSQKPEDFPNMIRPFLTDKALLARYQTNARMLAEKKYSREVLAENITNLLSQQ
jgi:glycosyltransferase involved in cell wall biosynthesis